MTMEEFEERKQEILTDIEKKKQQELPQSFEL